MKKLILGSSSPRRVSLLKTLPYPFEKVVPGIDERLEGVFEPDEFVQLLAIEKAKAILNENPSLTLENSLLLTADTIVCLNGEIIGKPHNKEQARKILEALSGRSHKVYTGVCYVYRKTGSKELVFEKELSETEVLFKNLDAEEIESYIGTEEPYDKAGGYAIQGNSTFMVKEIKGSYANVMGLPISEVSDKLKKLLK